MLDLFSACDCRVFNFFLGGEFSLRDLQSGCIVRLHSFQRGEEEEEEEEFADCELRELWGKEIGECVFGTAAVGCGVESRWEVWRKYRDGEFLLKSGETSCERAKRWIEQ